METDGLLEGQWIPMPEVYTFFLLSCRTSYTYGLHCQTDSRLQQIKNKEYSSLCRILKCPECSVEELKSIVVVWRIRAQLVVAFTIMDSANIAIK